MQHELITLYKQDGRPVRVNENSLNAAIALGWLEEKPQSEADKLEADKKTKKSK
jgi:hypothetical protein